MFDVSVQNLVLKDKAFIIIMCVLKFWYDRTKISHFEKLYSFKSNVGGLLRL